MCVHLFVSLVDERSRGSRALSSLRVSQSTFNCHNHAVGQDLTAMLACEERIDEELEDEKCKDQVKSVFL